MADAGDPHPLLWTKAETKAFSEKASTLTGTDATEFSDSMKLSAVIEYLEAARELKEIKSDPRRLDPINDSLNGIGESLALIDDLKDGDSPAGVIMASFMAGVAYQRHVVALYEKDITAGVKARKKSKKGGEGTRRLKTPEQVALVRQVFDSCAGPKIKKTEQRRRACAKLMKEHNVNISLSTLTRCTDGKPNQR